MRGFIDTHGWLTVFRFPSYAPRAQPGRGRVGQPRMPAAQPGPSVASTSSPWSSKATSTACDTGPACWTPSSPRPASTSPSHRKDDQPR
jgi:hypothetical protein